MANKNSEALYVIILRDSQANTLLKDWASKHRQDVSLANNRMSLYSQHSLSVFQVTWTKSWDNVTIWDTWNRKHIYLT